MAPRVVVTPVAPLAPPTSAGGESWGLAPLHPVQWPVRVSVVASAASGAPMRHHHVGRARARGARWPGRPPWWRVWVAWWSPMSAGLVARIDPDSIY